MNIQSKALAKPWGKGIFAMTLLFSGILFAGDAQDLSSIASNVQSQVKTVANLLIIIAYVAGIGFALTGILQFKAHKDNPAQVPLSKPIVYLCVGAVLLFLPNVLSSAGQTIFGTTENSSISGESGLK